MVREIQLDIRTMYNFRTKFIDEQLLETFWPFPNVYMLCLKKVRVSRWQDVRAELYNSGVDRIGIMSSG